MHTGNAINLFLSLTKFNFGFRSTIWTRFVNSAGSAILVVTFITVVGYYIRMLGITGFSIIEG